MPFKSKAQRRYLHSQEPKLAKEWEQKYPVKRPPTGKGAKLKRGKEAKPRKPLKKEPPPPKPEEAVAPPPPRKKPTLRVTQYNDGTFGLDWLDRG